MNSASPSRAQQEAEAWNREHPQGCVVVLRRDDGSCLTTRTRSVAYVSASGHPVIFVDDVAGHYLLSRVHPVDLDRVALWVAPLSEADRAAIAARLPALWANTDVNVAAIGERFGCSDLGLGEKPKVRVARQREVPLRRPGWRL